MVVPTSVVLSLMAALALNKLRLKNFFRVIYFAPVVTSAVAAGVVWLWVYNPDFGLINTYLQTWFGIKGPQWLLDPKWVMPSIALMSIWRGLGFYIVIFLAGLQGIPATYIEAAQIDGANRFQRFWYITLPLLSPTTFFIFIIAIINSFQVFDQAFIMTAEGGPANSAVTMVYYLRDLAFVDFVYGRSAAVAVILFIDHPGLHPAAVQGAKAMGPLRVDLYRERRQYLGKRGDNERCIRPGRVEQSHGPARGVGPALRSRDR